MPPSTVIPIPEKLDEPAGKRRVRKRWKTRGLMAAVVVAALASGLDIPAYQLGLDRGWHLHTRLVASPDRREWFVSPVLAESPFWPRYVRYLSGRPWRGQPLSRLADLPDLDLCWDECEHAAPEIAERLPDGSIATIRLSSAQRAEFERVKARDSRAVAFGLGRKPLP